MNKHVGCNVGPVPSELEAADYKKYLYLHGLSVETAEGLAKYHHKLMRQELGIANEYVSDVVHHPAAKYFVS